MTVYLTALPTEIVRPLANITVTEHQNLVLECEISKPNKKPKRILKGQEVTASAHIQLTSEGNVHKLTIAECELEDEGLYKIQVDGVESEATVQVDGKMCKYILYLIKLSFAIFHNFQNLLYTENILRINKQLFENKTSIWAVIIFLMLILKFYFC